VAQGLSMDEVAAACWEAVEGAASDHPAVLVGCSVGSNVVQRMYHLRPHATDSLVLVGAGWKAVKDFIPRRIADYRRHGLDFRYTHTLQGVSRDFARTPLAAWFATMFSERNAIADLDTIIAMFEALRVPDPEWLHRDLHAPVLILTGNLDRVHASASALQARLPDAELVTIDGAGHACQIEQPWEFDRQVIRFLRARGHAHLPMTDEHIRIVD
jgi:pimeloyl-ACP methyl ester carboxylesterase